MSVGSVETQLALLQQTVQLLRDELVEAKVSRKEQYKKMDEMGKTMISVEGRISSLEDSMTKNAPTIEEFITIKHKVVGAGIFGKWLWLAGGALIGLVASAKTGLAQWLG